MARCAAITRAGAACKAEATPGREWCYSHDPDRAAERQQRASKGGKTAGNGRPAGGGEIQKIKDWLRALAGGVLNGKVEAPIAYAINALLNTQLRAIELERKIRETDELAERIKILEDLLETKGKQQRWG